MMQEHDDELTMFDRTSLLGDSNGHDHGVSTFRNRRANARCHKFTSTFALCGAFFGVGLALAIPGPTLKYLQCNVAVDLRQISYIFPARSLGYLIGSLVGGFLFDKFLNKGKLLVSLALVLAAITIGAAPWTTSLGLLCILLSITSISMGFLDTGGNVLCLNIWGKDSGPYLQALHFAFGVGAFLAPLVAAPFLSSSGVSCATNETVGGLVTSNVSSLHMNVIREHKRETDDNLSNSTMYANNTILTLDTGNMSTSSIDLSTMNESVDTTSDTIVMTTPSTTETTEVVVGHPKTGEHISMDGSSAVDSSGNGMKDKIEAAVVTNKPSEEPAVLPSQPPIPISTNATSNDTVLIEPTTINTNQSVTADNTTITEVLPTDGGTSTAMINDTTDYTTQQPTTATPTTTMTFTPTTITSTPTTITSTPTTITSTPTTTTTSTPTTVTSTPTTTMTSTSTTITTTPTTTMTSTSTSAKPSAPTAKISTSPTTVTTTTAEPSTTAPATAATLPDKRMSETTKAKTETQAASTIKSTTKAPELTPPTTESTTLEVEQTTGLNMTDVHKPDSIYDKAKKFLHSFSKVRFSYIVIAGVMLLFGFMFCCLDSPGCRANPPPLSKRHKSENDLQEVAENMMAPSMRNKTKIMTAVFVFFFLYVGTEVAYGQFIAMFSIHHSAFTERNAAMLTSVYWGMFALARGLSVPLSMCMTPNSMLIASLVVTILSTIGLVIATTVTSTASSIWVLSGSLGIGMAAIFPTGVLWLEGYIKVTGKMAAVFVGASSLGEMIIPTIVGLLMSKMGPLSLIYTCLACTLGCAVTFVAMRCIVATEGTRYRSLGNSVSGDNSIPLKEFEFSDSEETDSEPIFRRK